MLEAEREDVAAAGRQLAAEGLVTATAGNVSVRAGDLVAVTASGTRLETLTAEQVTVVDLDGHQRDGEWQPTSELELHLGVYRRYGAGAVVHTHAPFATALACGLPEVPLVHYGLAALGGPVKVAGYATFGTEHLAAQVLDALEGRMAALMANHGTVCTGSDLAHALEHTRLLEWGCELYWRAAAVGTPRALTEDQIRAVAQAMRAYGMTQAKE